MEDATKKAVVNWVWNKWKVLVSEAEDGIVSNDQVNEFVKHRCATIHRWCRGTAWKGSDAVWAALARLQQKGEVPMHLQRKHKGGAAMVEWQTQSLTRVGWISNATRGGISEGFNINVEIVMNAFKSGKEAEPLPLTIKHLELSSVLRRLNSRFRGDEGVDLFHTIVAWCATQGKIIGDISRRKTGGSKNEAWWTSAALHLLEANLIPRAVFEAVVPFLDMGRAREIETKARVSKLSKHRLWMLDLCCGSQSRKAPAISYMRKEHSQEVTYIGVDICPKWWDGSHFIIPEIVGDLADDTTFPPDNIATSIASTLGLDMSKLIHVFMSTPCQTNSKADASNRNKMCAYRDWRHPQCQPLPVGEGPGYTKQEHHDLAKQHDLLEQKVIVGTMREASRLCFSFSAENPAGAMARKRHMAVFRSSKGLWMHIVNYCAFGGHYLKRTHLFHNMRGFSPKGTSGNGRCAGKGSKAGRMCPAGSVVDGKFKHHFTIGRESTKEFKSESVSRRCGKNVLPGLLTEEMVEQAYREWKCTPKQSRVAKRKRV